MQGIEMLLVQYGLLAVFVILLLKATGVPLPVPADVLIVFAGARAAQGKLVLWQVFVTVLVALVLGGIVQFWLARGPGRGLLYRFGRYIGLTQPRLDAASARVRKGRVLGISLAILVPGVRAVSIAAAGLADISLNVFVPGLVIGSALFLSLHLFLGYLGGSLLPMASHLFPPAEVLLLVAALLVIVYVLWVVAYRRQKAARVEEQAQEEENAAGGAVEVWHEGICPVCLALYTAGQLHSPAVGQQGT